MVFNTSTLSLRGISLAVSVCFALGAASSLSAQPTNANTVFSVPIPYQQTLARVPFMKSLQAGNSTVSIGGVYGLAGNIPSGWRLVVEHVNAWWAGQAPLFLQMEACTQSVMATTTPGPDRVAYLFFSLPAGNPRSTGAWPVRIYAENCSSPSLGFYFYLGNGSYTQVVPAGAVVTVVGYLEPIGLFVGPPL